MVKIGIVGCGGIARAHINAYKENGVSVSAVTDVNAQRAKEVGESLGVPWYDNYEAMFDAEALDGVSVCVPPIAHAPICVAALKRDISVLCEKPLARNLKEGYEILEAQVNSKGIFMIAFCHRFQPGIMKMKELIDEGHFGRIEIFRNQFAGEKTDLATTWFSSKEIGGGGNIIDTAIHSIDIFRYLLGDVAHATGFGTISLPNVEVENTSVILLRSVDGAIGSISASWATPRAANVVEVYGTLGGCIYDYSTGELKMITKAEPKWQVVPHQGKPRFTTQAKEFITCLEEGKKPPINIIDGLKALEVVEKVYSGKDVIAKAPEF